MAIHQEAIIQAATDQVYAVLTDGEAFSGNSTAQKSKRPRGRGIQREEGKRDGWRTASLS